MMIPRVIHRIWLGPDPLPEEHERYGETWRKHHPGWEMRLWTDSNLPDLRYRDLFDRARNHAERADVLRQELLLRFGGVYVDTDVECRRCIEPLIEGTEAFAAWSHRGRVGNAVLGAVPEHPAIRRILAEMHDSVGRGSVVEATGPKLVTKVLADSPDVTLFGSETFYPYSPREPRPEDDAAFGDAYAVHHWAAAWKTREDYQAWVRRLKRKLDQAESKNEELKRTKRRLQRRLSAAQSREQALAHELELTRRDLAQGWAGGWTRLRDRMLGAVRPAGRRLRALGARLRRRGTGE